MPFLRFLRLTELGCNVVPEGNKVSNLIIGLVQYFLELDDVSEEPNSLMKIL